MIKISCLFDFDDAAHSKLKTNKQLILIIMYKLVHDNVLHSNGGFAVNIVDSIGYHVKKNCDHQMQEMLLKTFLLPKPEFC